VLETAVALAPEAMASRSVKDNEYGDSKTLMWVKFGYIMLASLWS
jgi:hypothetical protein